MYESFANDGTLRLMPYAVEKQRDENAKLLVFRTNDYATCDLTTSSLDNVGEFSLAYESNPSSLFERVRPAPIRIRPTSPIFDPRATIANTLIATEEEQPTTLVIADGQGEIQNPLQLNTVISGQLQPPRPTIMPQPKPSKPVRHRMFPLDFTEPPFRWPYQHPPYPFVPPLLPPQPEYSSSESEDESPDGGGEDGNESDDGNMRHIPGRFPKVYLGAHPWSKSSQYTMGSKLNKKRLLLANEARRIANETIQIAEENLRMCNTLGATPNSKRNVKESERLSNEAIRMARNALVMTENLKQAQAAKTEAESAKPIAEDGRTRAETAEQLDEVELNRLNQLALNIKTSLIDPGNFAVTQANRVAAIDAAIAAANSGAGIRRKDLDKQIDKLAAHLDSVDKILLETLDIKSSVEGILEQIKKLDDENNNRFDPPYKINRDSEVTCGKILQKTEEAYIRSMQLKRIIEMMGKALEDEQERREIAAQKALDDAEKERLAEAKRAADLEETRRKHQADLDAAQKIIDDEKIAAANAQVVARNNLAAEEARRQEAEQLAQKMQRERNEMEQRANKLTLEEQRRMDAENQVQQLRLEKTNYEQRLMQLSEIDQKRVEAERMVRQLEYDKNNFQQHGKMLEAEKANFEQLITQLKFEKNDRDNRIHQLEFEAQRQHQQVQQLQSETANQAQLVLQAQQAAQQQVQNQAQIAQQQQLAQQQAAQLAQQQLAQQQAVQLAQLAQQQQAVPANDMILNTQIATQQSQLDKLQIEIVAAERTMREKKAELDRLQLEHTAATDLLINTQNELAKHKVELDRLQFQNTAADVTMKAQKAELDKLQAEKAEVETKLALAERTVTKLQYEYKSIQEQYDIAQKALNNIQQSNAASEGALVAQLQNERDNYKQALMDEQRRYRDASETAQKAFQEIEEKRVAAETYAAEQEQLRISAEQLAGELERSINEIEQQKIQAEAAKALAEINQMRTNEKNAAEQERLLIEQQKIAEQERLLIEQRKYAAEQERLLIEQRKIAEQERLLIEKRKYADIMEPVEDQATLRKQKNESLKSQSIPPPRDQSPPPRDQSPSSSSSSRDTSESVDITITMPLSPTSTVTSRKNLDALRKHLGVEIIEMPPSDGLERLSIIGTQAATTFATIILEKIFNNSHLDIMTLIPNARRARRKSRSRSRSRSRSSSSDSGRSTPSAHLSPDEIKLFQQVADSLSSSEPKAETSAKRKPNIKMVGLDPSASKAKSRKPY